MKRRNVSFKTRVCTVALYGTSILAGSIAGLNNATAQNIATIAGNNALGAGYTGDGGAATAAQLRSPGASVMDAAGNLFIADKNNNRIRKVDITGNISTICGDGSAAMSGDGGAATAAQINAPLAVCFDATGNLYIAEYGSSRIRKISTSGIISTVAGSTAGYSGDGGAATAAQLNAPTDVAVDAAGNIYICESGNHTIRKVNTDGVINTIAGSSAGFSGDGGPATAAQFSSPNGLALDPSGNIFVADLANSTIRKINTAGVISTIAGNNVYGYSGDGSAATAAEISSPAFITVDIAGNVFFSDMNNKVVRKVSPAGIISTVAGDNTLSSYSGDGGAATSAGMPNPTGVTFDNLGNLYITCQGDQVVRKVSAATVAITGTGTVCVGATTTLTGGSDAAVWSSSATSVATIGSASGIVTGVTAGTATISYKTGLGFGATIVTVNTCPTGIGATTEKASSPVVYPNPASGSFSINLPTSTNTIEVTVLDLLGKVVLSETIPGNHSRTATFSMAHASAGNYIVKITDGNNIFRNKLTLNE